MENHTHTRLAAFIGDLPGTEAVIHKNDGLVLGKSFTGDRTITKIMSVLSGKYPNGKSASLSELDLKDPASRFYIFVLLFHQYYTSSSKRMSAVIEKRADELARILSISAQDKRYLAEFLSAEYPYSDKENAVYFNRDKKAASVKYIGANIMYASGKSNEILYLKYFENYNLFLSKTFVAHKNPYHFLETINSREMNVISPANYLMDDFGYNTFDEIITSVKNHKPFQYFELAASANTPRIVLDPDLGKIIISGSSSPFSPTNFFEPILEWLQNYRVLGKQELQVFVMLDYFNTYTSKFLLSLCRQCDTMAKEGKQIRIYWYFDPEDSDMREFGEHLGSIYKKGFEYCLITDGLEELV